MILHDYTTDSLEIDLDAPLPEAPAPAPAATTCRATDKQRAFADKLGFELAALAPVDPSRPGILENIRDEYRTAVNDIRAMSSLIDRMKTLVGEWRKATPSPSPAEVPEGMHRFGGVIFKVQESPNSGRRYAKALVEDGTGGWTFEYMAGAIRNLSDTTRLSIEEAREFGALYGTCCVCGRTLTDEKSIEAGIGPVCSKKFF